MTFKELNLIEPIMHAVAEKGYVTPTPIQEQAIPPALEGRDLMGCAQTGTGKTAAFTLPILQLLSARPRTKGRRPIKALVLTPTRELAIQIDECCRDYARYTDLRHCVIFGGVNQRPQVDALQRGIDLLVATPGRLLDLIGQGYVSLSDIRFFVLDEADRMLDMGFIHDIKRILPLLPKERQTLFFSSDIVTLANSMLHDPVHVTVTPPASVVETISQSVMFAEKAEKKDLLISLLRERSEGSVLVFSRTKHGADRIARLLTKAGIAARGIDISELPLVINYDLPEVAETYVHRIGRTGRAGHDGTAIAFCSEDERPLLKDIQKLTGLVLDPDSGRLTPGMQTDTKSPRKQESSKQAAPKQAAQGAAGRTPAGQSGDAKGPRRRRRNAPKREGQAQSAHAPQPQNGGGQASENREPGRRRPHRRRRSDRKSEGQRS